MRAIVAFLPCWVLYLLGDMVSRVLLLGGLDRFYAWARVWHGLSSRLLLWSDAVQEWAGAKDSPRWPWDQQAAEWPDDSNPERT